MWSLSKGSAEHKWLKGEIRLCFARLDRIRYSSPTTDLITTSLQPVIHYLVVWWLHRTEYFLRPPISMSDRDEGIEYYFRWRSLFPKIEQNKTGVSRGYCKQSETRMHSSRMRTVRLLIVSRIIPCILWGWGLPNPPLMKTPWMQTPPRGMPPLESDPQIPPPQMQTLPRMQTHWSCDLWSMLGSQPPPSPRWTEGMTDACENVTLPQTDVYNSSTSSFFKNKLK